MNAIQHQRLSKGFCPYCNIKMKEDISDRDDVSFRLGFWCSKCNWSSIKTGVKVRDGDE